MKIRLAKTAGFCMGVRRAVDMALDLQRTCPPLPIVTYGPLIHNPQTLEILRSRGIEQVQSLDSIDGGTVIIRAHGISPQERQILEEKGVGVIDATCPRVARVQAVIRKHAAKGHFCVIVGDEDHPEVRGLRGFASAGGIAVASAGDSEALDSLDPARETCVVAQTTQQEAVFNEVVELLRARSMNLHVYNTICGSTKRRQDEVRRIAQQSDEVVVVGGKGSGNTQRLAKVAESQGVPALHIETADEIPPDALEGVRSVGVTAGASTPNWQIQQVIDRLKEIRMSRAPRILRKIRKLPDIAVMTYIWTALGGGGLAAGCLVLQGRPVTWLPLVVVMLFVFSMHLINRIFDTSGAVRFNTPEIASFYTRHRRVLTILGFLSSITAIGLSYGLGLYSFLLLAVMTAAGMVYAMPFLDGSRGPYAGTRSLKDIPGSKTPLVSLGWATAASAVTVVGAGGPLNPPAMGVSFLFATGMVFWRAALSDLLDIQGDRIVGRATIPILMGTRRTIRLLWGLLVFLAALLMVSAVAGISGGAGWLLLGNVGFFAGLFFLHEKRPIVDRLSLEGVIDGNFVLAGAVSILYGWT